MTAQADLASDPDQELGPERARAPVPVVFATEDGDLFGLYHAPDDRIARSSGVLLCNPLGYESMCTHRAYRHLAERLAAAGFHALRFDYHGTGDSSGAADEPHRVRAWLESTRAAVDQLQRLGARDVSLFGVRFGATLAAMTAAARHDVRGLILWAPFGSGRAYVRELRAFRKLKERGEAPDASSRRGEETAGYVFDESTVHDMGSIDLLAEHGRFADRALVLPRAELRGAEASVAKHLEALGVAVTVHTSAAYESMMRDPQDSSVPGETLDAIVAWLVEQDGTRSSRPEAIASAPRHLAAGDAGDRGRVIERAVRFGDDDRLLGIVTEPSQRLLAPYDPAVLFLNVGANHHVGPNRMYVSLARNLARLGFVAMRFDVSGIGDSPRARGEPENRLYSRRSVHDVMAAMALLGSTHGIRRFVLVGVCSGAYHAFHTSAGDPRVAGQILVNPQVFEWREGDSLELLIRKSSKSTRYYARALFERGVWAQALRGNVDLQRVGGVLMERLAARASAELAGVSARLRGQPEPSSPVARAFADMSERGIETLLIFSDNDGGLDTIEEHLGPGARKMRGRRNFRLELVEGSDHTFTPPDAQRRLDELVTGYMKAAFRDHPSERGGKRS